MENDNHEELIKKAIEAAKTERERAKRVEDGFKWLHGRKPSKKERTLINAKAAWAVSAVCDKKTGKVFTDTSGRTSPKTEDIHLELKRRIPLESLEYGRPVETCAEFKACNQALHSRLDAKLEDLIIATVLVSDGSPKERCENCKRTTEGANVLTD
jgi:hypothetical protein